MCVLYQILRTPHKWRNSESRCGQDEFVRLESNLHGIAESFEDARGLLASLVQDLRQFADQ